MGAFQSTHDQDKVPTRAETEKKRWWRDDKEPEKKRWCKGGDKAQSVKPADKKKK